MKSLLTLTLVVFAALNVNASQHTLPVPLNANGESLGFEGHGQVVSDIAYTLDSFDINPETLSLPNPNSIATGSVLINRQANQLVLTINRKVHCPPGKFCAMMVLAPFQVVLPIIHTGSGICGGLIVVAEQNNLVRDGGRFRVSLTDPNGNICMHPNGDSHTFQKAVQVVVTEQAARSTDSVVSTMTAFESTN